MGNDFRVAWLAGLLDGEGSIGIVQNKSAKSLRITVQMSITCKKTLLEAVSILEAIGIRGSGYSYQEKKPSIHKPSYHLRVVRTNEVKNLSLEMIPHSITKRRQWEIALRFCEARLAGTTVDDSGRVVRGGNGKWWKDYGPLEWKCYADMKTANQRGPSAMTSDDFAAGLVSNTKSCTEDVNSNG